MSISSAVQSLNNDPHCGDAFSYWRFSNHILICMVDGLGHGIFAEKAAQAAIHHVAFQRREPLPDIIKSCDKAIRKTRGVAMSLVMINEMTGDLSHAAIGNVRTMVVNHNTVHLGSDFGIVGGGYRSLSPDRHRLKEGDLVIMTTDGVTLKIDLKIDKLLYESDFEILANKILQKWSHGRDDAGVLVYKFQSNQIKEV